MKHTTIMQEMAVIAALALLSGCAVLEPNSIRIEEDHSSSVMQHFGPRPADIGCNVAAVTAHYTDKNVFLDISEGYSLSGLCNNQKEVFQSRVGYEFPLR